jgi:endonuclease YncB( thermonuclease family)
MPKPTWLAEARVIEVVDGDTFKAAIDLGWRIALTTSVRVEGINTPELPTAAGLAAKAYLERLLIPGAVVLLTSHRLDKYGRCQASITLPDGRDLGATLIAGGHASAAATDGTMPTQNGPRGFRPTQAAQGVGSFEPTTR